MNKSVLSYITRPVRKIIEFIKSYWIGILFILFIYSPRIIEGFTPVEELAKKFHEQSIYSYKVGAICSDGWISNAKGRGACSHHGGVLTWRYKKVYLKSIEECRKKAIKLSWMD